MFENLKKVIQQETTADRSRRMIPAAVHGAVIASLYAWSVSLVNVYGFPELPLGIDWTRAIGLWLGLGLAFALFGAIAGWFTEEYAAIVGGGLISTLLTLIWNLLATRSQESSSTIQTIIVTLPLIGVYMLAAWGLRWMARHSTGLRNEPNAGQRRKLTLQHIALVLALGIVPGLFGRMDLPAQRSLEQLHALLQAAPADSSIWPRLPLRQVPALQDHFGVDYRIYASRSSRTVSTMDVTVRFEDGFVLSCQLPIATEVIFITQCQEGK